MAQQILPTNTFTTAKWIVSATASDGTHTTIAGALTSASSGDTIFIRPGTYTENLTLKAGVNLTAFGSDSSLNQTGKVIISGKATFTGAGSVTISGIQLQTNSDFLLAVTGSAASIVNLINCNLNCTNNTGISLTSSSGAINLNNCFGDLGTTGIAVFAATANNLQFFYCDFTNSGGSSTANTFSGAILNMAHCRFSNPLTTSGSTAVFNASWTNIGTSGQNVTAITHGSTSATSSTVTNCFFSTGTASSISVSVNATLTTTLCRVESSNTNAITGAGTLINAGNSFTGTSSVINTTTVTAKNLDIGGISFDGGTNTLSTYTVGTFTPTLVGESVTGTTTYTNQQGYYVRIGSVVQIQFIVSGSAATGTGNALLGAYPFTVKNQTNGIATGSLLSQNNATWTFPAGTTFLTPTGIVNSTTGHIYGSGSASTGGNYQMFNAAFTMYMNLMYEI
jgi:hypothetical protein